MGLTTALGLKRGLRNALGLRKKKHDKKTTSSILRQSLTLPAPVRVLYKTYPSLEVVDNQLRIEGREDVLRLAPKGGIGVELGVFTGRFSEVLVRATVPKKLFLVDGWSKIYGSQFPDWGSYTDYGRLSTEAALKLVSARAQLLGGDIEIVEETSTAWLAGQAEQSLDWAYLDTSHAYADTLRELTLLKKALKPNGVILGDDCRIDPQHRHHGVFMAIRDFCQGHSYEIIHMDTCGQWAIRRSTTFSRENNTAKKACESSHVATHEGCKTEQN
jgi:hypothetical protein